MVWGRGLNHPHHITTAALAGEVGGIVKRIKTARLRRKTKPGRDVILHVRPQLWYHIEYQSFGADAKYRVPTMQNRFGRFDTTSFREIILLSGVFRRERANGFYPWSNVVSPRKRVAEGLCGWRHGNSFPMTQSAQSLCQMRSIPHCSKAVFYVFVFSIDDSATKHNLSPQIFHWSKISQNDNAIA